MTGAPESAAGALARPWVRAWIALGSNVGARRRTLDGAVEALRRTPGVRVRRASAWIETEPVGGPPGQRRYWNGVAELDTHLPAPALLRALQAIEARAGRDRRRDVRNGPRTLDLDLLLYGAAAIRSEGLEVPHPRLEERTFVLAPLAALAPDLRLPASGKRVVDRLAELERARRAALDEAVQAPAESWSAE